MVNSDHKKLVTETYSTREQGMLESHRGLQELFAGLRQGALKPLIASGPGKSLRIEYLISSFRYAHQYPMGFLQEFATYEKPGGSLWL